MKQRVQYSILLLAFRAQHRLAPPYITDLLEQRATRVLRLTTNNDFYVPPSRSRYGDRMFSVADPRLWNSLPAEIKKSCCIVTFKRLLKNNLFRAVYEVQTPVSLFNLYFIFTYLLSCTCFTLILQNVILTILISIYH